MVIYHSESLGFRDSHIPFMASLTNIFGGELQARESHEATAGENKYI